MCPAWTVAKYKEAPMQADHGGVSGTQSPGRNCIDYPQPLPACGRKVVIAWAERELHDLPARLVADALDLAGYDTHLLGADVPTGSLINVLELESPNLLALSITMSFHAAALRRQVKSVRDHTGGRLPIAGGALAGVGVAPTPAGII